MTKINVRPGQDISGALKAFKKKCAKDGILRDYKKARRFEKPSDKKRKQAKESAKRTRLYNLLRQM